MMFAASGENALREVFVAGATADMPALQEAADEGTPYEISD